MKMSYLKGELTPIPSRSPTFKCISCNRTFYPEDLDFSLTWEDFACVACKSGSEKEDLEAIGYGDYTDDIQKYTWEEYLSFGNELVDDIPF
ncbi:hypothetical protein IH992_25975 [Candidatus Poribacteria bacterium]|nr:hypothetical protein [Candidatus Poribacteria bacterium]